MNTDRRTFLKSGIYAGIGSTLPEIHASNATASTDRSSPDYSVLDAALAKPVLKKELFPDPVIIESCELLEYNGNYKCRVRSKDGVEGHCVGHNWRMPHLYPMQVIRVNPYFEGKDARDLDYLVGPADPPGRTERMIPMMHEAFDDDITIYAYYICQKALEAVW